MFVDAIDCLVAGGGVVGLSVARALAHTGAQVALAEAGPRVGAATSSRNSEVIHAGIYYPPGSAKARLCVRGREALYAYCQEHGVAHRRIGKLIVATDEAQMGTLAELLASGRQNGVDDLVALRAEQISALEPQVRAIGALWSPSTGIVDSHGLMRTLRADAEEAGALVALGSRVRAGRVTPEGTELDIEGEDGPSRVRCRSFVNAAGLGAQALAAAIEGLSPGTVPPRYLAKGNYFSLAGPAPFAHLVYPVPSAGGLGVHYTVDLGGRGRFGPDVEWIEDPEDLGVDPGRASPFYDAIRRYWPGLPDGALTPDFAGVRPKLVGPGQPAADFALLGPDDHGVAGQVHLFGIESPGLTASLAIAEEVVKMLGRS